MGMNLGYKTTQLFLGDGIRINNNQFSNGFHADGTWWGGSISGGKEGTLLTEADYIDLGIVTDEQEQVSVGGISVPIFFTSNVFNWNIGPRLIRLTITGIIPDGAYIGIGADYPIGSSSPSKPYYSAVNGKSNVSVFRFKLERWITLNTFALNNLTPSIVQYRRKYLYEITDTASMWNPVVPSPGAHSSLSKWTISGYSTSFINGTRNLAYTLNLDFSNNIGGHTVEGINPRSFGDFK
jgi:hypothetical protein